MLKHPYLAILGFVTLLAFFAASQGVYKPGAQTLMNTAAVPVQRVLSQDAAQRRQALGLVSYSQDVKPILDTRCVVCHACYDAPCQLKLSSFEGLDRGASKHPVYDTERFKAAEPSRLFIDATDTAQWRQKLTSRSSNRPLMSFSLPLPLAEPSMSVKTQLKVSLRLSS